jgi:hypothetical protein
MERVCVFCGEKPVSKNLEHVLPRWLLELTGDPKRSATFGYERTAEGKPVRRVFAFDAFRFPSCRECNQKFANLEASAKDIVEKMLSAVAVSEAELSVLLDWFDKVRIGLWLGYLYLEGNPLGIRPHFHVERRLRYHDRVLAIFKGDGNAKRLSMMGCDTPGFAQVPSCFSLGINNLWFLNMSYGFLLARRMGFPFPRESWLTEGPTFGCELGGGRNRIMRPILKKTIAIEGTELYQPMFAGYIGMEGYQEIEALYATEYVRDNCMSWEEGIGRIFIKRGSGVGHYDVCPSLEWLPEKTHDLDRLSFDMQSLTLEWQLYIMKHLIPSAELLDDERKRQWRKLISLGKRWNMRLMERLARVSKD